MEKMAEIDGIYPLCKNCRVFSRCNGDNGDIEVVGEAIFCWRFSPTDEFNERYNPCE
jgi:hypothetical protein